MSKHQEIELPMVSLILSPARTGWAPIPELSVQHYNGVPISMTEPVYLPTGTAFPTVVHITHW